MIGPGPSGAVLLLGSLADGVVTGVSASQQSQAIPRRGFGELSIYFQSIGTTSGGTLLIEEATWLPGQKQYEGTWSQIASVAASSFTGTAQVAYHLSPNAFGYVRVRISADITGGGTVVVYLESQA